MERTSAVNHFHRNVIVLAGLAAPALVFLVLRGDPSTPATLDASHGDAPGEGERAEKVRPSTQGREALPFIGAEDATAPPRPSPTSTPSWSEARARLHAACTETVRSDREDFLESATGWDDTERLGIRLTPEGAPSFTGSCFNPEGKQLLPTDHEQLEAITREYAALLTVAAEQAYAQLVAGIERCLAQDMYPYGARGTLSTQRRERPEDSLYSQHFLESTAGWSIHVQFESTDHLPFHEALRTCAELRDRRNARLREYIESL